jgi:hypothetical protein
LPVLKSNDLPPHTHRSANDRLRDDFAAGRYRVWVAGRKGVCQSAAWEQFGQAPKPAPQHPQSLHDDICLRARCEFLFLDFFHPVVERQKLVYGDGAAMPLIAGDDSGGDAVR